MCPLPPQEVLYERTVCLLVQLLPLETAFLTLPACPLALPCPWCALCPRRKSFMSAVDLLVELASLQTAFLTLDEAIKTTNRRVNALEHVVKPRLENTIAYIKVGGWWVGVGGKGGPLDWVPGVLVELCMHSCAHRTAPLRPGLPSFPRPPSLPAFAHLCPCPVLALFLQGELDELEREEFFRLKKVQSNKKKHAEAAEALAAADGARAKAANGGLGIGGGAALPADQNEAANVLQEHDADIIF